MLDNTIRTVPKASAKAMSGASSWLTINLGAIAANYRTLKSRVGDHVAVAPAVKANGYGLGAERVATTFYQQGARLFFVATMDEALNLRAQLPDDAHVAMLCGLIPGLEADYHAYNIWPVLNSLDDIERWQQECVRVQRALPAIIHFDTGMNRLGLGPDETQELILSGLPALESMDCKAIMSHFSCADESENPMTEEQFQTFDAIAKYFPHAKKSLCNSSGIFRDPKYHYDMVRSGMALCGLNPTPETDSPMQPVVQLETRILQIRNVDGKSAVGYGATYRFDKKGRQATVSMGYADGFLRHLGPKGKLYYNGQPCPITGRVSMDLVTVDISNIIGEQPQTGDKMEALGPHQSADSLAESGGTIGYEILTTLGSRYHRQYVEALPRPDLRPNKMHTTNHTRQKVHS